MAKGTSFGSAVVGEWRAALVLTLVYEGALVPSLVWMGAEASLIWATVLGNGALI